MTTFRVHFVDGTKIDVSAATPDAARKAASREHPSVAVTKIKELKGEAA